MSHSRMFNWLAAVATGALVTLTLNVPFAEIAQANESQAVTVSGTSAGPSMLVVEQTLLDLTNVDRANNGQPVLQFDPELLPLARERAASQLGTQQLSHYDAAGQLIFLQMLQTAQIDFGLAGENLARSSPDQHDAVGPVELALMSSPLHRKNILEQGYDHLAVGAATGAQGQIAYAEIFRGTS